jgi:hypothetical protein
VGIQHWARRWIQNSVCGRRSTSFSDSVYQLSMSGCREIFHKLFLLFIPCPSTISVASSFLL